MTHIFKKSTAAAVLIGAVAAAAPASAQEAVRIGTATSGSVFYTVAVAVSDMARKHAGINSTVQPLGGSAANVNGLHAKRAEFAMANAYNVEEGYKGTGPFKGKKTDVRLVLQGQPSYRGLFVRKDAGIKSIKDFKGKTVASDRPPLPTLKVVFETMVKANGLDPKAVTNVRMSTFGEQKSALVTGSAVGGVFAFGTGASTIAEMLSSGEVIPFYMTKGERDKLVDMMPSAIYAADLPAKIWPEQTEHWNLFAMNTYFSARTDVPADTVYKIVKSILDHPDEFNTYHAAAKSWTLKGTLDNPSVPFHEGAIRYFKEKGVWTPKQEAQQVALLKKQ